jgi:hypothetical protein
MKADEIEVYCNGDTFMYDVPTAWPNCSALAVCQEPNLGKIMKHDHPDGQYIMEGTQVR